MTHLSKHLPDCRLRAQLESLAQAAWQAHRGEVARCVSMTDIAHGMQKQVLTLAVFHTAAGSSARGRCSTIHKPAAAGAIIVAALACSPDLTEASCLQADGHCLYRAIDDQLRQCSRASGQEGPASDSAHSPGREAAEGAVDHAGPAEGAMGQERLRASAAGYMRSHAADFEPFLDQACHQHGPTACTGWPCHTASHTDSHLAAGSPLSGLWRWSRPDCAARRMGAALTSTRCSCTSHSAPLLRGHKPSYAGPKRDCRPREVGFAAGPARHQQPWKTCSRHCNAQRSAPLCSLPAYAVIQPQLPCRMERGQVTALHSIATMWRAQRPGVGTWS